MPPKKAPKSKAAQLKAKGGKKKKKKWTQGKVQEKVIRTTYMDQETWDRLYKEVPNYKVITPGIVSDRMKISVSLARKAILELEKEKKIKPVIKHNKQLIYTRAHGKTK
ncbi:40S ribosomal protein S25 [Anaeramoeba flamelloides]|uniref:40S ribosomal protein S25 n=1 Tax=Anaeramoeba flamelloides TaxID=1746091 RepID=A0AAV8AEA2_9EUKA|nr:40S ribosomal protein S25 [Anaeramoeba flamelloides]KAJ6239698.1 40S ribosomal protein S25 [Anaeramoeba flamelloides]KAJ6255597.1 40S ribosomal protein S25 [Anaeramoeba flamelloides]